MPLEIEAKMKMEDFDALRRRLRAAGAKRIGDFIESNIFLDEPGRSLLNRGSGLRLRRMRNARSGKAMHTLTYKGKLQRGRLKTREEIETSIGDFDAAIALLERLGFEQMLSFEKKRQSWRLDACQIELDELPRLGRFVEIEGPNERSVMAVRKKLFPVSLPLIRVGYAHMVADFLRRQRRASRVLQFD